MSLNLQTHIPLIQLLCAVPPKIIKTIFENADPKLIAAICEIVLNLCEGNIKCTEKDRKELKKYRKHLHRLATAKHNSSKYLKEKKILSQKGGAFLPLFLPAALSLLTEVFEI